MARAVLWYRADFAVQTHSNTQLASLAERINIRDLRLHMTSDAPIADPPRTEKTRFQSVVELLKPKIALTVGYTVLAGYLLGVGSRERTFVSTIYERMLKPEDGEPVSLSNASFSWTTLACTLIGVTCVAFASAVLNQAWEHRTDAAMSRTAGRPIPTGRVSVQEAMLIGMLLGPWAAGFLTVVVNPLTGILTAITCVLYVFAYTPLKRVSAWATFVGAIPGAMPPVLGWTAATNRVDFGAIVLFAILFLWQFPHFIAIAWKYREQYHTAGLFMLPANDESGRKAGVVSVVTAALLAVMPLALTPTLSSMGLGNWPPSILISIAFSLWYLYASGIFLVERTTKSAMKMLGVSFIHVLVVFGALIIDGLRGL